MGMDTWYDLQIEKLVELTDRVSDQLDELQRSGASGGPPPTPRVRELFGLTDRVSGLLGENRLPEPGAKDVRRDE